MIELDPDVVVPIAILFAAIASIWVIRKSMRPTRKRVGFLTRLFRRATDDAPPSTKRPPMPIELRQPILVRDGYKCMIDGCPAIAGFGTVIEVHHWLPFRWFPKLFYATWNLVSVCRKHNRELSDSIPKHARNWDKGGEIIGLARQFKDADETNWRDIGQRPKRRWFWQRAA